MARPRRALRSDHTRPGAVAVLACAAAAALAADAVDALPVMHSVLMAHVCPFFFLQPPLPSQRLVLLQLFGSSAFVIATQVPPGAVHAWQVPHEAAAQQTPSTQLLLVHSPPAWQVVPLPFLGTQVPALQ